MRREEERPRDPGGGRPAFRAISCRPPLSFGGARPGRSATTRRGRCPTVVIAALWLAEKKREFSGVSRGLCETERADRLAASSL